MKAIRSSYPTRTTPAWLAEVAAADPKERPALFAAIDPDAAIGTMDHPRDQTTMDILVGGGLPDTLVPAVADILRRDIAIPHLADRLLQDRRLVDRVADVLPPVALAACAILSHGQRDGGAARSAWIERAAAVSDDPGIVGLADRLLGRPCRNAHGILPRDIGCVRSISTVDRIHRLNDTVSLLRILRRPSPSHAHACTTLSRTCSKSIFMDLADIAIARRREGDQTMIGILDAIGSRIGHVDPVASERPSMRAFGDQQWDPARISNDDARRMPAIAADLAMHGCRHAMRWLGCALVHRVRPGPGNRGAPNLHQAVHDAMMTAIGTPMTTEDVGRDGAFAIIRSHASSAIWSKHPATTGVIISAHAAFMSCVTAAPTLERLAILSDPSVVDGMAAFMAHQ